MKNILSEIITGIGFLILLFFAVNPFQWFMPSRLEMGFLIFSVIVFGLFGIFILRESARDEREVLLRMSADRFAYLVGSGTVLIIIARQALRHDIDDSLFLILVVMVSAKVVASIYARIRG